MPLSQEFIAGITGPRASEFWSEMNSFLQNEAFRLAAEDGQINLLNILVEKTPEPRKSGMIHASFDSSFESAATRGHLNIVNRIIDLTPNGQQKIDMIYFDLPNSAFIKTVRNGHLNVVERFIELTKDLGRDPLLKEAIDAALADPVLQSNPHQNVVARLEEERHNLDRGSDYGDPVAPIVALQPQVAIQAAGAAYVAPEANPSQLQVVAVPPAGVGAVDVALDPQPQVAERPNPNPITLFASRLVRLFTQCFTRNNDSRVAPGGENAEAARGAVGRGNRVHPIER